MTKEQAIQFANCLKNNHTIDFNDMADFCDMAIKALEQQGEDCVSLEVYKQVISERDIAIEQLKELGYEFGEKIRTFEDCVSRQAVKEGMIKYGFRAPDMTVTEFIEDELPPITPTFPKNATNGDMIKAMFPNVKMVRQEISSTSNNIVVRDDSFLGAINRFHADWWNAPYTEKRGNEE